MTLPFPAFARLVNKDFQRIARSPTVLVAGIEGDDLYAKYLAAFPPGTDPLFRKRTEHDCGCCRHFIRRTGAAVSVTEGGKVLTVWDSAAESAPAPYRVVAAALRDAVLAAPLADLFRVSLKETSFGAEKTHSQDPDTHEVFTWNHFYTGEIPEALRAAAPNEVRGAFRTKAAVFERGLKELTPWAVAMVRELTTTNNVYRGSEHAPAVKEFQAAQRDYLKLEERERSVYVWAHAGGRAAGFRNTVIGTLVTDLSSGVDVEAAVRSFESKVAPQNYKRPSALITPGMIKAALEKLRELDLESALERRLAIPDDVPVGDMMWVAGGFRPLMKGGLEETLLAHVRQTSAVEVEPSRAEDITLDDFMARVAPTATGMELLLKNELLGNLAAITAPKHPEPKQLFRWLNDFAWAYGGNVADSIRERVKKAGGRVDGATLRVSLSWSNHDDLDLHVHEPGARGTAGLQSHIHFRNKKGWTGGCLDVDMNAGHGTTREPVENVVWTGAVPDGSYRVVVNQYHQRETSNPGFVVEVENGGVTSHFTYNKAVRQGADVPVCTLRMKGGVIESVEGVDPAITTTAVKQTKWGLTTGGWVMVNAVAKSPNYWGENATGNRHTFFVLEGCVPDEELRGFFNEFLNPRLEPHRKVLEVVGDKTKCEPVAGALAGVGFSSTKKDSFAVRVRTAKGTRAYNVQVG